MTMKQREDHAQAKYWNGFITRVEAQKVFEEQTEVIMKQAEAFSKFDAVLTFLSEKLGVTAADVNAWIATKVEAAQKAQEATNEASADKEQEVSSLATA